MEVEFVAQQRRACRVRLSLDACIRDLKDRLRQAPHLADDVGSLLARLEGIPRSQSASLMFEAEGQREQMYLTFIAADFVERAEGFVWCPECKRDFPASTTTFERYERGRGEALSGRKGRRFYCGPFGHLLFEVVDERA